MGSGDLPAGVKMESEWLDEADMCPRPEEDPDKPYSEIHWAAVCCLDEVKKNELLLKIGQLIRAEGYYFPYIKAPKNP